MRYARERRTRRISSEKRDKETGVEGSGKPGQTRERRKESEIEKRLWLWTTDYQRGLAYGPDHRCDLVGRTNPSVHQVRKTHLRETIPPQRLGVVISRYGIALSRGYQWFTAWISTLGYITPLLSLEKKIILLLSISVLNLLIFILSSRKREITCLKLIDLLYYRKLFSLKPLEIGRLHLLEIQKMKQCRINFFLSTFI